MRQALTAKCLKVICRVWLLMGPGVKALFWSTGNSPEGSGGPTPFQKTQGNLLAAGAWVWMELESVLQDSVL